MSAPEDTKSPHRPEENNGGVRFMRGLLWGVALSVPFWILIYVSARQHPIW